MLKNIELTGENLDLLNELNNQATGTVNKGGGLFTNPNFKQWKAVLNDSAYLYIPRGEDGNPIYQEIDGYDVALGKYGSFIRATNGLGAHKELGFDELGLTEIAARICRDVKNQSINSLLARAGLIRENMTNESWKAFFEQYANILPKEPVVKSKVGRVALAVVHFEIEHGPNGEVNFKTLQPYWFVKPKTSFNDLFDPKALNLLEGDTLAGKFIRVSYNVSPEIMAKNNQEEINRVNGKSVKVSLRDGVELFLPTLPMEVLQDRNKKRQYEDLYADTVLQSMKIMDDLVKEQGYTVIGLMQGAREFELKTNKDLYSLLKPLMQPVLDLAIRCEQTPGLAFALEKWNEVAPATDKVGAVLRQGQVEVPTMSTPVMENALGAVPQGNVAVQPTQVGVGVQGLQPQGVVTEPAEAVVNLNNITIQ